MCLSIGRIPDRTRSPPPAPHHRAGVPRQRVFFTFGDALSTFFGGESVGWRIAAFAASNFLGALLLSPLFDSVGRVRMIAGTYILSGLLLAVAGLYLHNFTAVTLTIAGMVIFFSPRPAPVPPTSPRAEIFPMETRALYIAFFYAIGAPLTPEDARANA